MEVKAKKTIQRQNLPNENQHSEEDFAKIKEFGNEIKGFEEGMQYASLFRHYFWFIVADLRASK